MSDSRPSPASRPLWWWFALAALVPAAALIWLGFGVVQQDRASESDRLRLERERVSDAAVRALARTVSEFEDAFAASVAAMPFKDGLTQGAAVVAFGSNGVVGRAGIRLPYHPVPPAYERETAAALREADELEFSQSQITAAVSRLLPATRSEHRPTQAGAWLRLGRLYKKLDERELALQAFERLASLDDVLVDGLPAGNLGRTGTALILAESNRASELRQVAETLRDRLRTGSWVLTQSQFAHALQQTDVWLGTTSPPLDAETLAMCAGVESLWREWLARPKEPASMTTRKVVRHANQSMLVFGQARPHRLAIMLVRPSALDAAWRRNLELTGVPPDTAVALTDPEDDAIAGKHDEAASERTVRAAALTKLPWNVHVVHGTDSNVVRLSTTAMLVIAGIGLMLVIVLASAYAINRAVSRELRVVRLQSEFVDAVSHEFRSPLATIRQLSELLATDRVSTDERKRQFYTTILSESQRMNRMVENLLDFARLEAGRLAYRREPVDVSALVGDVAADVRRGALASAYQFELEADANLPQILGDRDALKHVFHNLLDNAVKYSPDCRTVWVSIQRGDQHVAVRVRDGGLGIPSQEQREIFRKFVRGADATAARIGGTGVGLALAREIVEAHGGTIAVESAPGHGSTFTVTLPGIAA